MSGISPTAMQHESYTTKNFTARDSIEEAIENNQMESLTLDWAREPRAHLRYAILSFKFLLSMQSRQHVIGDYFGNVYWRVPMRGNGFRGFNSLWYSLTGNQQNYNDIINDFANVYVNVPDLFRTRTNFGARLDPSLTVDSVILLTECSTLIGQSLLFSFCCIYFLGFVLLYIFAFYITY